MMKDSKNIFLELYNSYRRNHEESRALIKDLGKNYIKKPKGYCLVSYLPQYLRYLLKSGKVGKFDLDPEYIYEKSVELLEPFSNKSINHTMFWNSVEIVRQFIERDYIVDCIFDRDGYLLRNINKYDVIVDEWTNLPGWSNNNPFAKKLYYATGSHWIYHNKAELIRHEWLLNRRGREVPTRRQVSPILSPENADLIAFNGNKFNAETYSANSYKIRKLWSHPVTTPTEFIERDWESARKRFLYFGSTGWVHRGLDLIIEAFLKEPDFELVICGPDNGFLYVYEEEIKRSGNIHYYGYISPKSDLFTKLSISCGATIYPTASEGASGSVIQCMMFGLIPIVTENAGMEIHEIWKPIQGKYDYDLIEDIRNQCHTIASKSFNELNELSHVLWNYVHEKHSRISYRNSLSVIIDELID